jgi:hypothetical protein
MSARSSAPIAAAARRARAAGFWLLAALWLAGCSARLSGTYSEVGGAGRLEFRGAKVYVTTVLGTTFVTPYEVDGNRIIIKGAGGSQVYTLDGDTLDGGMGMKFVKD